MSQITVAHARERLPLTRLAHFTPARNLYHIVQEGMIRSSKDLADNAPDYFTPTDRERFDRHPDKICCSFEYPNGYYLSEARRKTESTNYPDWACLLLDAKLILRPGTLFCGCNAARSNGAYLREGGQALLDCYAAVARPDDRGSRGPRHHPGAATDLQAEALVPGPVDLSYLRGIVVPSEDDALQLYGVLSRHDLDPERFRWVLAPGFFNRNILSNYVRFGGTLVEETWNAPTEQEKN
jgi:hypothetical protein